MGVGTWALSDVLGSGTPERSNQAQATVRRVDTDGTVWCEIAGGAGEFPASATLTEVREGDAVMVRIADGRAVVEGSTSQPSISSARAAELMGPIAAAARRAQEGADVAQQMASAATASAEGAAEAAVRASEAASAAGDAAAVALESASDANDAATGAMASAEAANASADEALAAAMTAGNAANGALSALGDVEKVVGTVNWIAEHGTFEKTEDVTVQDGKAYYIADEDAPNGYAAVSEPDDAALGDYYELKITESVQNYIATHLALTTQGLELFGLDGGYRAILATDGLRIIDPSGNVVGSHGQEVRLGLEDGLHLLLTASMLAFMAGGQTMGYFGNDAAEGEDENWRMFIPNARITDELQFGNYVWKPRNSGANITLRYVGA